MLDLYAENPGRMVVRLKLEDGETRRLVDKWMPSIFVASDSRPDLVELEKGRGKDFSWSRFVSKYERVTDKGESEVLELVVDDAKKLPKLAESIELSRPFGTYRLYNVDVPPEQLYLYENDLFPLAYCDVSETRDGLAWDIRDDIWACEYAVPEMRSVGIVPGIKKSGRIPRFEDPIASITLTREDGSSFVLDEASEAETLLSLVKEVKKADPDIVFTEDGDAFVLPYLAKRAAVNGISERFSIDREGNRLEPPAKKGTSYFSYGKILFKPSAVKLLGRIHLDAASSFVCRETGLEGFYEVSRICRLPLHTASRASIGKALSSLQFYHATKEGIMIPWKPTLAESFKSRAELLVADRGGFIFEPELGVHEGVGELDFSSLFPSIMNKKNISPETVRCECCPDSATRVPELGWNVCERRQGIVSKAVKILVEKRTKYKRLEKNAESEEERTRYRARRDALKWVAVACLPKESPVFIRNNGVDRFVKIGEFIDGVVGKRTGVIECPPGIFVAGINHDYKARYCKIARLIKKPNDQKLLSLSMEDGRQIVTTPDHQFFTLENGMLKVRRADELRIGGLVPVARKIPPANEINQVDLIGRLENLLDSKEQQLWRVMKMEKLIESDIGVVRVARIKELDICPDFVYCFELAEDEVPGFFAGEGLILIHNCFGYLGFNNAKFGRIDAHIAVCAWDRKVLIDAARVAERRGFRVMHGIVDSLWLKKEGASEEDYRRLRKEIEIATGFNLSFEGIYKWIVFAPSKVHAGIPVLNRYFGVYRDGNLKIRGIEARRHDTPTLFSRCQLEMLSVLAKAGTIREARVLVKDCIDIFLRYAWSLLEHEAPIGELVFTRNLSKKPGEYANHSLTSCVADRLVREGIELHAGESVRYVITDYWSRSPSKRAVPVDLIDEKTVYDSKRYVELLAETCSAVVMPFRAEYSPERLVQIVSGEILHAETLG